MVDKKSIHQNEYPESLQRLPATSKAMDAKEGLLDVPVIQSNPPNFETVNLDWDGPNDVDNPHNWPKWKKIVHSAIPATYGFALCVQLSDFILRVLIITARLGLPHLSPGCLML
jgi:hypothetical protein